MKCPSCGNDIANDCVFCPNCGNQVCQPVQENTGIPPVEPVVESTEEALAPPKQTEPGPEEIEETVAAPNPTEAPTAAEEIEHGPYSAGPVYQAQAQPNPGYQAQAQQPNPGYQAQPLVPVISTVNWLGTLLLWIAVPVVMGIITGLASGFLGADNVATIIFGILTYLSFVIFAFVGAFINGINKSKRNFFRAYLWLFLIMLVLIVLLVIVFGTIIAAMIPGDISYLMETL